jgi:alpha-tubulin suppressor-like RCC1 family protein
MSCGYNCYGELGIGHYDNSTLHSVIVPKKIIKIAGTGCCHSLALAEDGTVFSWGCNACGQLGLGDMFNRNRPTQIEYLNGINVADIYAGGYSDIGYNFLVTADGKVYSFGRNTHGQLALGDLITRNKPVLVPTIKNVKKLALAYHHALCITRNNRVYAWGTNRCNSLGVNFDGSVSSLPIEVVSLRFKEITDITAGCFLTYAIEKPGYVWRWGDLGSGEYIKEPTLMQEFSNIRVKKIAAGHGHTLCLTEDGKVYAWGYTGIFKFFHILHIQVKKVD